tara:strand:+ start:60 stop:1898 length:1839 start_codon:yes stop_codon:yes gene_type:complete
MSRTQRRDFFEAALQNPTNIFMTIHGGPLSYSSQTASENMVGIVPEGCILVIITPPQAVVFSSPTEDTETFRFFQQKNWIKTLLTGSSQNCYGASKYIPSWIDQRNIPKDEEEEIREKEAKRMAREGKKMDLDSDSDSDSSSDEEDIEPSRMTLKQLKEELLERDIEIKNDDGRRVTRAQLIPILEDIIAKEDAEPEPYLTNPDQEAPRGKIRESNKKSEPDVQKLDSFYFYDPEDEADRADFYARQTSSNAEKGFEVLNNIQIFFPGDRFYNQFQEFDAESIDFDAYCLGPLKEDYRIPYTGNTEDECIHYGVTTYEGDDEVTVLVPKKNVGWEEGDPVTTDTHKLGRASTLGAQRVPYFNRDSPIADHANVSSKKTTQQVLDYIMQQSAGENKGLPKMVILNSCSPSKPTGVGKKRTYRTRILDSRNRTLYENMKQNIAYRGQVYFEGTRRYCELRSSVRKQGSGPEPLLPFWVDHQQFTRIDKEDLAFTHNFIGKIFLEEDAAIQEAIVKLGAVPEQFSIPPQTISQELFLALYTIASTDRRGTIMIQLRNSWIRFFGTNEKPYSWENMVYLWNQQLMTGVSSSKQGGKRKRTRRKRKKKRKKTLRKRR